jgi:putative Mg2+ transporter-C (MgtC) family protein
LPLFEFSPLIGIAGAAVLGGAIGLQRQAAAKPAGFRTHLVVAAASAAFTAMGAHLHDTRIPSYVVVGIGFLGAGSIVRQGTTPHGLTTAASIWMSAAVGLAMGYANSFSLYVALVATAITLVALAASDNELMRLFRIPRKATLRITCSSSEAALDDVARAFADARVKFESRDIVALQSDGAAQSVQIVYLIDIPHRRDLSEIVREIGALSCVSKIEANEPFFVP